MTSSQPHSWLHPLAEGPGAIGPRGLSPRRSKLVARGGVFETLALAHASGADVIQLELESGFDESQRPAAVRAVCRALEELDWSRTEAWVRLPPVATAEFRQALPAILSRRPQLIYCAKVTGAADIQALDAAVAEHETGSGIAPGCTQIGAVIEQIDALDDVEQICSASPRMGAIMFGANDLSLDFGYRRVHDGTLAYETLYIRSRMALAARLAGIAVFDAACMLREDVVASDADAVVSARLGFTGKTALSAGQVEGIHRAFAPLEKEVSWARAVCRAAGHPDPACRLHDGGALRPRDIRRAEQILRRVDM